MHYTHRRHSVCLEHSTTLAPRRPKDKGRTTPIVFQSTLVTIASRHALFAQNLDNLLHTIPLMQVLAPGTFQTNFDGIGPRLVHRRAFVLAIVHLGAERFGRVQFVRAFQGHEFPQQNRKRIDIARGIVGFAIGHFGGHVTRRARHSREIVRAVFIVGRLFEFLGETKVDCRDAKEK